MHRSFCDCGVQNRTAFIAQRQTARPKLGPTTTNTAAPLRGSPTVEKTPYHLRTFPAERLSEHPSHTSFYGLVGMNTRSIFNTSPSPMALQEQFGCSLTVALLFRLSVGCPVRGSFSWLQRLKEHRFIHLVSWPRWHAMPNPSLQGTLYLSVVRPCLQTLGLKKETS